MMPQAIAPSKVRPPKSHVSMGAHIVGTSGKLRLNRSSMSGELSTANTRQPRAISARVSGTPLPHPASSTHAPRGRLATSASTSGTPT